MTMPQQTYKISNKVLSLIFILFLITAFEYEYKEYNIGLDTKNIVFKKVFIKAYHEIVAEFKLERVIEPNDNLQFLFTSYEDKDFDIEDFILEYKMDLYTGLNLKDLINQAELKECYYKINIEMLAVFYIKVLEHFNLIFKCDKQDYMAYQIYLAEIFLKEIKNIQKEGLFDFAWNEYNYADYYLEKEVDIDSWKFFWKFLKKDIIKYKKELILYYSLWYIIFFVIPWQF